MTKEEIKHINWMYNRLTSVHKENPNVDYMMRFKEIIDKQLTLCGVSFELPSDEIFDMPEVDLKNPLEEFYYYERPPYLKSDQKDFKERLQKALNYLKGTCS